MNILQGSVINTRRAAVRSGPDETERSMDNNAMKDVKVGEFLMESGLITNAQLAEALALQRDNPDRLVGEILVTQGVLTKEDLIMAMEMYLMVTGVKPKHVDEWLDQDEIDMLLDRIGNKNARK
jgi:hypothetical protein